MQRQRYLLTAFTPLNRVQKEGRDVISGGFVFVSNFLGFDILSPHQRLIAFPQLGAVLAGRFYCWEGQRDAVSKPFSEEGNKRVKKQQGKSFPISSPRTL